MAPSNDKSLAFRRSLTISPDDLPQPKQSLRSKLSSISLLSSTSTLKPTTSPSGVTLKIKPSTETINAIERTLTPMPPPAFSATGPTHDVLGRLVFVPSQPPPEPVTWAKYFPGGYNANLQIPLRGKKMMYAIQAIGGLAILFYGYDQGVMSGVVINPQFKQLMGVDSVPESKRDSAAVGGIVAIYYAGSLFGGLVGGYLGDKIGRVKTVIFGCMVGIIGAALQASSMGFTWMCIARVISGFGTGHLNAIIPVWSSEVAEHDARGSILAFEFFLNIAGLAFAYWLEFVLKYTSGRSQSFIWRFPLAFQLVFLIILIGLFSFFPESPRYLAKVGRKDEARQVLAVLRTENGDLDDDKVNQEMYSIMEVVDVERKMESSNNYTAMIFGSWSKDMKNTLHLVRRTWLVIGMQFWQELTGIGVITVYAPTVFQSASYTAYKADWLSGVNNIFYMFSVLVAVFTLDRVGRRVTLYWGAIIMAMCLALCTVGARYAIRTEGKEQAAWGAVVAAFTFVYTSTFGASWLTVPWLYPTEIFPLFVRAKGGAVSVVGWSIGNGVVTEITPFLFNAIGEWTFLLFSLLNVLAIPWIYFLYPETAGRSLEQMDILFAQESIFVHRQQKMLEGLEKVNPEIYHSMETGKAQASHVEIKQEKVAA
ncbi:hypothetical protein I302_101743 [Kwoniella bestiolae CBS 10118]|uniref:Major facilitator superfamily (MFS) profile domain-containing protein n=1 Tax=Kwoniella bestiolae CBS 10118 TaxID=1296100 RepID=A0A1B9GD34_9TREE|nr:hypothetical protein I302_00420 [Kwoniella bestiolae CBS 10118]OCF28930.1 hypothetical protein I302_00420 [Kwoniella bestiolae CBS 10118]